jgi:opacity protein-like surface antigen
MKKILLLLLLLIAFFQLVVAQSKTEIGVHLGASYYQGDINKSKVLYSPSMSYGVIVKYNLSKHLSARVEGIYGTIKGSDSDFNLSENIQRGASFSANLIDFSAVIEFNFMPYTSSGYIKKNDERFTPFVFVGVGASIMLSSGGFENPVTIPFGLGIKYNIFERLTLGLEWSYRKTFNDQIDGVINIQDDNNTPVIHNDDWYSFCGFFLTYKITRDKIKCPTYQK